MLALATLVAAQTSGPPPTLPAPAPGPPGFNVDQGPDKRKSKTAFSQQLHEDLFETYVKEVSPSSDRSESPYILSGGSLAGTDVSMSINFYKVEEVDVAHGHLSVMLWLRLRWTDERLSWDPADYGGITNTKFMAAGHNRPEETQIWVPDLELYNAVAPMSETMSAQYAEVSSNGTIFWSRPGRLQIACRFGGLVAFPFDSLTCPFEIGSWATSGIEQGLRFQGKGYTLDASQLTSGESYSEYSIRSITPVMNTYFYQSMPSQPFSIANYRIELRRAQSYYWSFLIIPSCFITVVSFSVFWLDPGGGERLGFVITLYLAMEVSKVVLTDFVPVCGELLWIDIFTTLCSIFTMCSVLECVWVISVAQKPEAAQNPRLSMLSLAEIGDHINAAGAWIYSRADPSLSASAQVLIERKYSHRLARTGKLLSTATAFASPRDKARRGVSPPPSPPEISSPSDGPSPPFSAEHATGAAPGDALPFTPPGSAGADALTRARSAKRLQRRQNRDAQASVEDVQLSPAPPIRSPPSVSCTPANDNVISARLKPRPQPGPAESDAVKRIQRKWLWKQTLRRFQARDLTWQSKVKDEMRKLLFFETIYYKLDRESRGYLFVEELRVFLSYAAMDMPIDTRVAAIRGAVGEQMLMIAKAPFVRLCSEMLMDSAEELINLAVENCNFAAEAAKACETAKRLNSAYAIDEHAKILLPSLFLFMMVLLFGLEFTDGYDPFEETVMSRMFEGFGPVKQWHAWSYGLLIAGPFIVLVVYYLVRFSKARAAYEIKEDRLESLEEATRNAQMYDMSKKKDEPTAVERMASIAGKYW